MTVVVPVFNSEPTLRELVTRIHASIPEEYQLAIVMVDDGSHDKSWSTISEIVSQKPFITGVKLKKNVGQHLAIAAGILQSDGDVVITIDDDLQYHPEDIPKLLQKLSETKCDVVYGVPKEYEMSIARSAMSQVVRRLLSRLAGIPHGIKMSSFRAFNSEFRDNFIGAKSSSMSVDVVLSWSASKYESVEIKHFARGQGISNYTISRLVRHALDIAIGLSIIPLRLATYLGLLSFIFSAIGTGYVLYTAFAYEAQPPGYASTAILMMMFASVQLLAVGLLGEYVGRLIESAWGKPLYVVESRLRSDERPIH